MQEILNPNKTRAILIGTSEFKDFDSILAIENNIDELAKVFADKNIFGLLSKDNIQIIKAPSDQELKSKLIQYTETAKKDKIETLIVYFAGHGFRNREGKYFLATKNSEKELIRLDGSSALAYDAVKKIFHSSKIPKIIILIDACYSGSAAQGEGEEVFDEYKAKGTYTLTSSDSTELSYYDTDAKHTIFTGELLNIFNNGISDNETEQISLSNLYTELRIAVKDKNSKMSPQKLASKEITGENFLLCKNIKFDKFVIKRKQIKKQIKSADKCFEDLNFSKAENIFSRARRKIESEKIDIDDEIISYLDKKIEDCERIFLDFEVPFRDKYENEYKNKIADFQEQIIIHEEQKNNLEKTYNLNISNLTKKAKEYTDDIKKLNNVINVEKGKSSEINKQLKSENKRSNILNDKINILENEILKTEEKYNAKKTELIDLLNQFETHKEQTRLKIVNYDKDTLKKTKTTTLLQENINSLQNEIKQLKEKVETHNNNKQELFTEINTLKKNLKKNKEYILEKDEEIRVIKELNSELTQVSDFNNTLSIKLL